jgi:K(+)-stimulated pyrophosphate-energized sodium pump
MQRTTSFKYWKLGFYCLNGNCLFLSSKIYVACNYENGILLEGMQDISSMRVFYATIVGLVVGAVISSVTEYYWFGTKPVMAIVQNQVQEQEQSTGLATGMISTFPTVYYLPQHLDFICTCWFYGVALRRRQ